MFLLSGVFRATVVNLGKEERKKKERKEKENLGKLVSLDTEWM